MVSDKDYLSLTSPHPIKAEDGHVYNTVAEYVAYTIFRGLGLISEEHMGVLGRIGNPWNAIGIIYQAVNLKTKETTAKEMRRHVEAVIVRGLLFKFRDHKDARTALLRTRTADILAVSDHQTVCTSKKIADIQNRLWGCGSSDSPGENLYGKCLQTIRSRLIEAKVKNMYIITSSKMPLLRLD